MNQLPENVVRMLRHPDTNKVLSMVSPDGFPHSIVLGAVIAFVLAYATAFLLRRRKKEFGLYLTMGMTRGNILALFAGETAVTFLCSLAAGVLLFIPEYLLRVCIFPVLALDFRFWLIGGFTFGGCMLLWYLICLFLSGKVNLRPLPRALACLLLGGALVAGMCLTNLPVGYDAAFTLIADYGGQALLVRHEGGVSLVASGRPSSDFLEKLCLREGVDRFAEVIFLAPAYEVNAALPILLQYAEADVLYVAEEADFSPALFRTVEVRAEGGGFPFGGFVKIQPADMEAILRLAAGL